LSKALNYLLGAGMLNWNVKNILSYVPSLKKIWSI